MTVQCCVCGKVKEDGAWKKDAPRRDDNVSHTYCPVCLEQSMKAIQNESIERRAVSVAI